jgi:hypothetical protein
VNQERYDAVVRGMRRPDQDPRDEMIQILDRTVAIHEKTIATARAALLDAKLIHDSQQSQIELLSEVDDGEVAKLKAQIVALTDTLKLLTAENEILRERGQVSRLKLLDRRWRPAC